MYQYETHMHTRRGSSCASISGREQAIKYKKAGYTGIIVTEHFFRGSTSLVPHDLPWEERIHLFCRGYEEAKTAGDEIGLQVFFGWEETYYSQDFLVYGLNKEWLLNHPEMEHWTLEEQFEQVNQYGGMVIHAHPFRDRSYIDKIRLFPKLVNGVETYNASNSETENQNAYIYAKKYGLPITAGGDTHHMDADCSGIRVDQKFNSVMDYVNIIKNRGQVELIYA